MPIRGRIKQAGVASTKVEIEYAYQRAGLALTGVKDAINR